MDETPARIHGHVVQQPLHGPLATPGDAVMNLLRLFGNVDMHRRAGSDGVQALQCRVQAVGRHGAQGMRREAQHAALRAHHGREALEQREHVVGAVQETPLALARRLAAEAAGLVEHRQQRDADAGTPCRAQQRERHLGVVGIGAAAFGVVQVMELAHRRVARLQHLHVEPGGDRLQRRGRHARGEAVHQVAPAPERVVAGSAELGQAGEGALEGMGMQVGQARQQRTACARHGRRRCTVRLHVGDAPVFAPAQQHVFCPAAGQQGLCGEDRAAVGGGRLAGHRCTTLPCRTIARGGWWPNQ